VAHQQSGAVSSISSTNDTVAGNAYYGHYAAYGTTVSATNAIVWGNTLGSFLGTGVTISYSDVEGGAPGPGNIASDPRFVDTPYGDLHLGPGSPASTLPTARRLAGGLRGRGAL